MDELKNMLDISQLCEITGWKRGYVYNLISQGRITHYKPFGKKVYFKRSDLESLMDMTPILSVEDAANNVAKRISKKI